MLNSTRRLVRLAGARLVRWISAPSPFDACLRSNIARLT